MAQPTITNPGQTNLTPHLFIPRNGPLLGSTDETIRNIATNFLAIQNWADMVLAGGAGLRFYTRVIAASNSLDTNKLHADYVCTGTNDQTTIQQAINDVTAVGGGHVHLMEGTYNVDCSNSGTELVLGSNVTLEGQGYSTVIRQVTGKTFSSTPILRASLLPGSLPTVGCQVMNLTLDGSDTYAGAKTLSGIFFDNTLRTNIANVQFVNFGAYGINNGGFSGLSGCFDWTISSCYFAKCGDFATSNTAGIWLNQASRVAVNGCLFDTCHVGILNTSQHVEVSGCIATACSVGFYDADLSLSGLGTATDSTYTTCDAYSCASDGFVISGPVQECNLTGCTSVSNTGNGFQLTNLDFSVLSACSAVNNGQHGFLVQSNNGGQDSTLVGCFSKDNSQSAANTYDAFNLGGALSGSIPNDMVQQCMARGTSHRYGCNITAKANTWVVVNNDFHASGTTANFIDNGVGTILNLDGSANNWNRRT